MLFKELNEPTGHSPDLMDQPLASRMRPQSFDDYAGQEHIIATGKLLRRAIEADSFTSLIFYGPPGIGKTSLAELIARMTSCHFERLSGVTSSVKDIRQCIQDAVARRRLQDGMRTIMFIDEIHRFNKAQQDVLLPDVESGVIRLIGATTENPFFYIVGPLVSRSQVFQLEPLNDGHVEALIRRACTDERGFPDMDITITDDAMAFSVNTCEGDARRALTAVEVAVKTTPTQMSSTGRAMLTIDLNTAEESMQRKAVVYGDDGHYDTASAFIKSMRGSDPDAAVYWLAKMLEAGEDIRFIARRIVIFASEDVGNADPRALTVAVNAMQACDMIGMPEARIILAQAVTYCATAPKSNACVKAIDRAMSDVRDNRVQPVPEYLRDSHYKGAERLGHGQGYVYPHDLPEHIALQDYMQVPETYYEPGSLGYEQKISERLVYWKEKREQAKQEHHDD